MVETLLKVINIFEKEKIPYCLIGGLAVMLHGGRANTIDIDFYVMVEDLDKVRKAFRKYRIPNKAAGEYQIKAKYKGIPIDILYADHYIGLEIIQRAKSKKLENKKVKIATPEDLIILKTLADRSIDRRDIEELKEIFSGKLNQNYLRKKLTSLRKLLKN